MSSLYNLEPQPTAKVLLQTTSGDIELELFAKQTPLTSRNFLQLCLDGYYTNTIFHRLVPGFILQGGDPTGTGSGGEAIYDGGLFADEFHSRLKFNRRGLLGMANTGRKDDNGSQFFLTLGKAEELNGRNTLFGRVAGETIYNLMRMAEAEVVGDGSERPLYPTRITGAEVLVKPFEDMVRSEGRAKPASSSVVEEKGEAKKKPKKRVGKTLLSFGAEEEEGDVVTNLVVKKAKFNTKLVVADEKPNGGRSTSNDTVPKPKTNKTQATRKRHASQSPSPPRPPAKHPRRPSPSTQLPLRNPEIPTRSPLPSSSSTSDSDPEPITKVSSLLTQTNAQIASLKASMKRTVANPAPTTTHRKSALEQMIPAGSTRGRKRKHGGANGSSGHAAQDREALAILSAFREKLDRAPPETKAARREEEERGRVVDGMDVDGRNGTDLPADEVGGGGGVEEEALLCDLHFIANCQSCRSWDTHAHAAGDAENDDGDDDGRWLSHALSFAKDRLGKDLAWRRKNEEELVVIDPREKGKEIMEEGKRARRGGRGA